MCLCGTRSPANGILATAVVHQSAEQDSSVELQLDGFTILHVERGNYPNQPLLVFIGTKLADG